MTDAPQAPSTAPAAEKADSNGFLTPEQLKDRSRFQYDERVVELPELGGGKLLLRGITVAARTDLATQLPDNPRDWKNTHTALSLAKYVANPQMSQDDWLETIKPWPAAALDRVNRELAQLINIEPEEEKALAVEFPVPE